jgi:hypothetical protein
MRGKGGGVIIVRSSTQESRLSGYILVLLQMGIRLPSSLSWCISGGNGVSWAFLNCFYFEIVFLFYHALQIDIPLKREQ